MSFGKSLSLLLGRCGIKDAELASSLRVTTRTIYRYRDVEKISEKILGRILDSLISLGVDERELEILSSSNIAMTTAKAVRISPLDKVFLDYKRSFSSILSSYQKDSLSLKDFVELNNIQKNFFNNVFSGRVFDGDSSEFKERVDFLVEVAVLINTIELSVNSKEVKG